MNKTRYSITFLLALAACGPGAGVAPPPNTGDTAPHDDAVAGPKPASLEGSTCAGKVDAPPAGAKAVEDDALAQSSLGAPEAGKLCMALTFEATTSIKVYRVWNSQKAYTQLGSWWSFEKPVGPVETYREQNEICPEWSALDKLSSCDIKVGAHFAMGPGQSAKCEGDKVYAPSPVNQVFIPNDTRKDQVFVEHCEELGAFP